MSEVFQSETSQAETGQAEAETGQAEAEGRNQM